MDMMKCVVKTIAGDGNLELTQRPVPGIGSREVLIRVKAAAICGTDVHIRRWNEWAAKRVNPPTILGHEFAGEVVRVGDEVTRTKVGDIVSAETHIVCGTCEFCRSGKKHVCPDNQSIGVQQDGCFAEYIAIPEDVVFVCDPLIPLQVVSILEPFGVAVHAVMEFPVTAKTVVISGCGPIGIMAVTVAKKTGAAKIIAVEPNLGRAQMARELGADMLVNPADEDAVEKVKALTGGLGADIVLEFSGSIPAIKSATSYVKSEGKLAIVGLPSKPLEFDIAEFAYKGITLKGIAGRLMYENWNQIRGLLESGLDLTPIVTHTLPLEKYEEGLRLMESGECCKCVLMI